MESDLEITCPRCKKPATVRFYGPCDACFTELRASMGNAPTKAVQEVAYEPKMNVTPNAVALKE